MEIKKKLKKPFTEVKKMEFIVEYNDRCGYEIRETSTHLEAWGKTSAELLEEKRQEKYDENEVVRERYLISGVTYKEVLFDSDLEQKLNISVQVSTMSETDTVDWTGMDGITKLTCTKADLLAIGALLTQMTSYVWSERNPEIKTAIQTARTIEELEGISIYYQPIQSV